MCEESIEQVWMYITLIGLRYNTEGKRGEKITWINLVSCNFCYLYCKTHDITNNDTNVQQERVSCFTVHSSEGIKQDKHCLGGEVRA